MTPVDRVFTRLGAEDFILQGASTFLVELKDVSNLMNLVRRSKRSVFQLFLSLVSVGRVRHVSDSQLNVPPVLWHVVLDIAATGSLCTARPACRCASVAVVFSWRILSQHSP